MFCLKCGAKLEDGDVFCSECGEVVMLTAHSRAHAAEQPTDASAQADESAQRVKPRGFSNKRNILIIVIALVVLIIGGAVTAVAVNYRANNNVEHIMTLAERYLDEMKYEQAIIKFERVIKLDPMNADAYIGLAEAYLALDDEESAIEALDEGYERTESKAILKFAVKNKLEIPGLTFVSDGYVFTKRDEENSLKWLTIEDNVVTDCSEDATVVVIPEGVTKIGDGAFQNLNKLTAIYIPDGVTSINSYAFEYCWNLEYVRLPDDLERMGMAAFGGENKIKKLVVPDSLKTACYICMPTRAEIHYKGKTYSGDIVGEIYYAVNGTHSSIIG